MKIGITMFPTDRGLHPKVLAKEIEDRDLDSLFLPEHSHIPISRRTVWPGSRAGHDDPLPDYYSHLYDQIVALSMAGAVTERIVLGTSVTLLPQHDPVWLAKQVATLDRLTDGRFVLGVGFGWNVEQGETHGVSFKDRRQCAEESVAIMRSLWSDEVAEFKGEMLELQPSWAWPKPVQRPGPPVVVGGMGLPTYNAIAKWADGWMPITSRGSLQGRIEPLREAFVRHDRDPDSLRVFVCGATEEPEKLANLAEEGVEHACFTVWSEEPDEIMRELDRLADVALRARG